jgi:hypothetical protein
MRGFKMFYVKGKLINQYEIKIKSGKKAKVIQVLSNGAKANKLLDITDYDNREWETGECEIPVYVNAYNSKRGNVGLNVVAVGSK